MWLFAQGEALPYSIADKEFCQDNFCQRITELGFHLYHIRHRHSKSRLVRLSVCLIPFVL